jgi:hypothetical protein
VTGDREERNRVLGFPVDRHPNTRPASKPQQAAQPRQAAQARPRPQDAEPQRVLGLPVDWLDGFADEMLRILRRIRGNRNLKRRK